MLGTRIPPPPQLLRHVPLLLFPSSFPRNLLSGSDDGFLSIYDTDPFVLLMTVKVHRKGVNDLAVHPTGKLVLTVGRDSCFGMVNLVRGRRSFCCMLGKEATIVRFSLGGERFFMVMDDRVTVHEAEDAKLVWEFECKKQILCAAAGKNGLLFTGGEDRGITAWDTRSGKYAYRIGNAHSSRVKGIVVLTRDNEASASDDPYLVASASSDGVIRVWDIRMAIKEKPNPLAEAHTKSRLTCLAGSSLKREESQDEEVIKPYTPTTVDTDVGYFELVIKMYPQGRMSHHFPEG